MAYTQMVQPLIQTVLKIEVNEMSFFKLDEEYEE